MIFFFLFLRMTALEHKLFGSRISILCASLPPGSGVSPDVATNGRGKQCLTPYLGWLEIKCAPTDTEQCGLNSNKQQKQGLAKTESKTIQIIYKKFL